MAHFIKREDVDALNEHIAQHREEKAKSKAGLPFLLVFYLAIGYKLWQWDVDIFFESIYWMYGALAVCVVNLLAVGVDFGTRVD